MLPSERFIIILIFSLFSLLGLIAFITLPFIIRKKPIDGFFKPYITQTSTFRKKAPSHKPVNTASNAFTRKLGEKVVQYMIEVAWSDSEAIVRDRIEKIRKECDRLSLINLPNDSKDILSTVHVWAKRFNVHRHLAEMKIIKHSSQITYDQKKHDFKLLVAGD